MSQQPQEEPSIVLPVIALVCAFLCWPLGLILGIVCVVKYSDAKGSSARTLSIVALVLPFIFLPIVGIMAAIAIPNFVKFQCRSKQSEAKGNLKALFVAEESLHAEGQPYTSDLQKAGFTARGAKIRYDYVVDMASPGGFHAVARATDPEMHGDAWEIDNTNQLKNTLNGCDAH